MSAPATNITVLSPTTLAAVSPAGAAGLANVTVTTSDGSGFLPNGCTYAVAPTVLTILSTERPVAGGQTVTAITPDRGPADGGQLVTVTGAGFTPGSTQVGFG